MMSQNILETQTEPTSVYLGHTSFHRALGAARGGRTLTHIA